MINTLGGRFGGYGLYLVKSKPVFTYVQLTAERIRWEGPALTPGKHTIAFDFTHEGEGFGKGGTGVLSVDGKEVDTKKMPYTIPFLVRMDESFDVGDRHPLRRGRQRLPGAVPVHRQAQQADDHAEAGANGGRGSGAATEEELAAETSLRDLRHTSRIL